MTRKRRKKPVAAGDDWGVGGWAEMEGLGDFPDLALDFPTLDFPELGIEFPEAEAALASLGAEFDAAVELLDDDSKRALEIPDLADPD